MESKVLLNMLVPGASMFTQEDCESNQNNYELNRINLEYYDKKKRRKIKDVLQFRTRGTIPAKQTINISLDAYKDMVSSELHTESISLYRKYPARIWKQMGITQRLEAHLKNIAESFNAISYTYQILND